MAETHQGSSGGDFDLSQFYQIFFEEAWTAHATPMGSQMIHTIIFYKDIIPSR
jgi:hypothetical protein